MYEPLDVFVALTGIVVWNQEDMIEITSNATEMVYRFLEYRANVLSPNHPNDAAFLLTNKTFDDGILGK